MDSVKEHKDNQMSLFRFTDFDFSNFKDKLDELGFKKTDKEYKKETINVTLFEDSNVVRLSSNKFDGLHDEFINKLGLKNQFDKLEGIGHGLVNTLTISEDYTGPINDILNIIPYVQIEGMNNFIDFAVEFNTKDLEENVIYTNVSALPPNEETKEQNILITIGINKDTEENENIDESITYLRNIAENYYKKIVVLERGDNDDHNS